MAWGRKVKLGKDQAWDFVKNDWKIKEMDVVYSLDTKEDISIAFELMSAVTVSSRCHSFPDFEAPGKNTFWPSWSKSVGYLFSTS